MKDFIKENIQFIIMLLVWVAFGIIMKETSYLLVPAGLILLKSKGMYTEMIAAFFFILFLSDNRHNELLFAAKCKDLVLLTLVGLFILDSKSFPNKSKLIIPFIPFFIVAFIMSTRNWNPVLSFQKCLSFSLMLGIIPSYFIRQLETDGRRFLRMMIWTCTTMWLLGFVMMFLLNDWVYLAGRYNGLLGNPNGIGILATLFFIFIMLSEQKYPDLFSRNERILVYGSLIISVLFASSRNAIFSIMIFVFFGRFYKISSWLGFMLVLVVAILYQAINENLPLIINSLGLGEYMRVEHLNDGSGRLIAWTYGWREIQNNFMLGRGFAYEEMWFEANKNWLNNLGHQGGIHNTYLALWMNTGLVGLLLYLYGFFRTFFVAAQKNYYAVPTMFAIMFSMTFEAWFQASLNPFTIIALLIITLLQYDQPLPGQKESSVPVL